MEINLSGPQQTTTTSTRSLTSNSDFETFLRMLTTQVQNQDPLSPLETSEFANQLAAFTMVEQQTLTNQTLNRLLSALEKKDIGSYAQMVGRTAVHLAPFYFSGQTVSLEISGLDAAETAKLVVLDSDGKVVAEQAISPDAEQVTWTGRGSDGSFVAPGTYTAQLRSVTDDRVLPARAGLSSTVEEVRFDQSEIALLMSDGSLVPESAIMRLR